LDCAGTYDLDNQYWTIDFDLGVAFTEIFHVYVDWSGEITGGLAIEDSNPDDPFPVDVGIYASLGFNPSLRRTTFWGGAATWPDPELFHTTSEIELTGTATWSDLLDGQGSITIGYEELIIVNGAYIQHGSVDLRRATLVVDGIPIPEPMTFLFFAAGMLVIRSAKNETWL